MKYDALIDSGFLKLDKQASKDDFVEYVPVAGMAIYVDGRRLSRTSKFNGKETKTFAVTYAELKDGSLTTVDRFYFVEELNVEFYQITRTKVNANYAPD